MDAYEATKIVLQRIQSLDPENASKIMGLLLIQDHGDKEMIRLALGPEALLQSVILKSRKELAFQAKSSPSSSPSTPSSPSPFSNSMPFSRRSSSSLASSRFFNGGNLPSLSIPNHALGVQTHEDLISPGVSAAAVSYAAVNSNGLSNLAVGSSFSTMNSSAAPFYAGEEVDLVDEFQLQDQLSFLNDGSPTMGARNSDLLYSEQELTSSPSGGGGGGEPFISLAFGSVNDLHRRRSYSVSDVCVGCDDPNGSLGWKPCLYFARGYCKNGTSCRFLHCGLGEAGLVAADNAAMVGSPSKFEMMEQCQELLRSKPTLQQQRLAAASQLMASTNFPYSPVAAEKCVNYFLQHQQFQAESPRGDFRVNGGPALTSPGSRQIYLTFPADSTFKEEDVSNYFSTYGPVQDVRIPYQQKRMFGFVTFVYSETVRIILAKGNPHFVCDSRVLVKPYKEKGKVPDKLRKQQHVRRGEFTGCGSPTGLGSRDLYDLHLGGRRFYDTQDMLWRKLDEQADLQQAIELQNRRLMGLQLDVKRSHHHRRLSTGAIISSPFNSVALSADRRSPEKSEDNGVSPVDQKLTAASKLEAQPAENASERDKEKESCNDKDENFKESPPNYESDLPESLESCLPDSPFASPKAASKYITSSTDNDTEVGKVVPVRAPSSANNDLISASLFPAATSIAPLKSCYFLPSLASDHETVRM